MAFNVFEGARRLMAVGLILILAIGVFGAYSTSAYITRSYSMDFSGTPTAVDSCPAGSEDEYKSEYIDGGSVGVTLCFPGFVTDDGRTVIGYVAADGQVFGNNRYAPEVDAYIEKRKTAFSIPPAHLGRVSDLLRAKKRSDRLEIMGVTIGCMFGLWLLSSVVGWIVRGFFGIPGGADRKPSAPGS
jgi:hypothetical protein